MTPITYMQAGQRVRGERISGEVRVKVAADSPLAYLNTWVQTVLRPHLMPGALVVMEIELDSQAAKAAGFGEDL